MTKHILMIQEAREKSFKESINIFTYQYHKFTLFIDESSVSTYINNVYRYKTLYVLYILLTLAVKKDNETN